MDTRERVLRWICRRAAGVGAGLLLAGQAVAQLPTAALSGRISSGGAPDGARVVARCQGQPPVTRTAAVEQDGTFLMDELPAGPCRVHAEAPDHEAGTTDDVVVASGEERKIDLALVAARKASAGWGWTPPGTPEGAVPLPTRSVDALILMSGLVDGDRGPWGGIRGGALHGT